MAKKMQVTLPEEMQERQRQQEELFEKQKAYAKLVIADLKTQGIRHMQLKLDFIKRQPPTYTIRGLTRDYAIAEIEAAINKYTDALINKKQAHA